MPRRLMAANLEALLARLASRAADVRHHRADEWIALAVGVVLLRRSVFVSRGAIRGCLRAAYNLAHLLLGGGLNLGRGGLFNLGRRRSLHGVRTSPVVTLRVGHARRRALARRRLRRRSLQRAVRGSGGGGAHAVHGRARVLNHAGILGHGQSRRQHPDRNCDRRLHPSLSYFFTGGAGLGAAAAPGSRS